MSESRRPEFVIPLELQKVQQQDRSHENGKQPDQPREPFTAPRHQDRAQDEITDNEHLQKRGGALPHPSEDHPSNAPFLGKSPLRGIAVVPLSSV